MHSNPAQRLLWTGCSSTGALPRASVHRHMPQRAFWGLCTFTVFILLTKSSPIGVLLHDERYLSACRWTLRLLIDVQFTVERCHSSFTSDHPMNFFTVRWRATFSWTLTLIIEVCHSADWVTYTISFNHPMTAATVRWRPTSSLKFPGLVYAQPSVERLHCYLTADFYIELSLEYSYVELLFGIHDVCSR